MNREGGGCCRAGPVNSLITFFSTHPDHLFDLDASIELAASPELGFPDCFNSGVLVLRPSAAVFAQLTARAAVEASFDGGDQGLLNAFFGDGTRGHPSRRALLGSPPSVAVAAADDDDRRSEYEEGEGEEIRSPLRPAAKDRRSDSGVGLAETTMAVAMAMTTAAVAGSAVGRDWFRLSFTYNMEMHRV